MKVGDLVKVTKKHGAVELGIIIEVDHENDIYPHPSYDVMCVESQRMCFVNLVDLELVTPS